MENSIYKHETGLIFEATRLMSSDEKSSYDITVVCMWLPNCRETPMLLVDWYCGEPNKAENKRIADEFCGSKTLDEIKQLIEVQDMK